MPRILNRLRLPGLATVCVLVACVSLDARDSSWRGGHGHDSVSIASARRGASLRLSAPPGSGYEPQYLYAAHSQGSIQITMTNWGEFGVAPESGIQDPFTGERVYGLVYPRNSDIAYLYGSIAVGAVVGYDTLVSECHGPYHRPPGRSSEFSPDIAPFGEFTAKSIDPGKSVYSPDAFSELDLTCVYYDTLNDPAFVPMDPCDKRLHIPLGIRVTQRSMAWSGSNLDDFILINYEIANIGGHFLSDVYVGVNAFPLGQHIGYPGDMDNLTGFLHTWPAPEGCGFIDSVNVAYGMDNTGDPRWDQWDNPATWYWDYRSARAAVGIRVLGMPAGNLDFNYNWNVPEHPGWGPRRRGTSDNPFRRIGTWLAIPEGDNNTYYVMAHEEFDYDQLFGCVDFSSEGWLPPRGDEWVPIAEGAKTEFLQSFGPFDLPPRATVTFTIAIVAGDSVHVNPRDFDDLFGYPYDKPWAFYNSLDFSRLALNARWAAWAYDNPGVDTDGDGYLGEFRICDGDTFWYKGDGEPDFRADFPPPAPKVRVIPSEGKLVIRWNGYHSELFIDPFTRLLDFEGYRVYAGLDSRKSSLSLLSSYDHENYSRYRYIQRPDGLFQWSCNEPPFTLDSLRKLYDDPDLEPLRYRRADPLRHNDTLYYFTAQDYNVSDLTHPKGIRKAYPEAVDPGPDTSLWTQDDLTYEHDIPLPKYYEYEYVYDNLLSTVTYHMGVTAFDFGLAEGNIPPKESNLQNNLIVAYAQTAADSVEEYELDAYVYPNPYLYDAHYHQQGFENRDRTEIPARSRRIHFANLPRVCKISIYSLDGDLIRELDHNFPEGGPEAMHDSWDLITRNTQAVVSGLYYYVIESRYRTQIGKFAIIM